MEPVTAQERHDEVADLKTDKSVRRELEQTTGSDKAKKPKVDTGNKFRIGILVLLFIAFAVLYYASRFNYLDFASDWPLPVQRIILGGLAIVLVLLITSVVKAYLVGRLLDAAARYNLNRVANLLAGLAIFFIALSVLFANWYTAVVSLGLISLILGFALQTPITSFIGWVYILVKAPYQVGDRIRIGEARGDVIGVSYLDTTLWEFGGEHLATDHPSGRIIKFPNSNVLDSAVYNYSWSLFPYIWNDIKFQIAYQSDLQFVERVLSEVAEEEVGEAMMERIRTYRELLSETPVDELEVKEHPVVVFRVSDNTWVEAIVRYLVEPRHAGPVKSRLIKKMLDRLNAEPDKAMFPKGDNR